MTGPAVPGGPGASGTGAPGAFDTVTCGEVMAMFVAAETGPLDEVDRYTARLAGAEMNVAVGLSRLGHRVRYLSAVGADPFGARARRVLAAEGVAGLITDPDAPTGFQLKSRATGGDPEVVYFRSGSAAARMRWSPAAAEVVSGARHLHVTGIFPALSEHTRRFTFEAVAAARRAGATVSFDPNLRPALWPDRDEMRRVLRELTARADWVLPGIGEGEQLFGESSPDGIAARCLELGASTVVTKLGAAGAELHTRGTRCRASAFPVEVVDTVGAGDGFAAGFISARLDGCDDETALHRACAVGALATTSEGDMDGLPTREQLGRFDGRGPALRVDDPARG